MKNIIAIIFFFLANAIFSQDTIQYKNGTIKIVRIDEILSTEIKYHTLDNLSGPVYVINTQDVSKLILKNERVHDFPNTEIITESINTIPTRERKAMTPSSFGHYISMSGGYCNVAPKLGGPTAMVSYSFAYKSHLFTATGALSTSASGEAVPGYPVFDGNYIGMLLGESFRTKFFMLSASIGVGFTNIDISVLNNSSSYQTSTIFHGKDIISMPLEFKLFHTSSHNGIGVGIHIVEDVLSVSKSVPSRYNSFYFGVCLVTGFWNKAKN